MSRRATILKYWLPVLIWMGLIFYGSGNALAQPRTSRFLAPFIHWLLPGLSAAGVDVAVYFIRKLGHVTEYAVLALWVWRALRQPGRHDLRPWSWPLARMTLLVCVLYAASDEFHQSFVPAREARIHDIMIDTCGATAALLLLWGLGRWRKNW